MPQRFIVGHAGFAEQIFLAEIVAVVSADNHSSLLPQILRVDHIEQLAEPMIDHRQLRAIVRANVVCLLRGQHPALQGFY